MARTVARWVGQERIDRGDQQGLTSDERARLAELERENRTSACARNETCRNKQLLSCAMNVEGNHESLWKPEALRPSPRWLDTSIMR